MAQNERFRVTLTEDNISGIRARLDASSVSAQLFEKYKQEHKGELPPYLVSTLFDFLPPGIRTAIFLYDPSLIEELHVQKHSQLKSDRQGFQKILKYGLGVLTTQPISDPDQRKLRTETQAYLDLPTTNQNVAAVSEIAQNTMKAWADTLGRGEAVPLSDANHYLYIEYVCETMIGRELSPEFKREMKWAFLEGVRSAILPHMLQKIVDKRAAAFTTSMIDVVKTSFEEFVRTGEKVGVIDDHLEFFLKKEFSIKKDDEAAWLELRKEWKQILDEGSEKQKKELMNELSKTFLKTARQAMGTISAGFETTANVNAFVDVMAATYPEQYQEVVQEVSQVEDIGKLTVFEMVTKLQKLYAFCAETLLHYPPLGLQFKVALEDGILHHQGAEIKIKKGTLLFPDHLSSAEFRGEFDLKNQLKIFEGYDFTKHMQPNAQKAVALEATSHQPFEAKGIHNCIGKFMAMMELMVTQFWKAKYFPQPVLSVPEGVDPTKPVLGPTNSVHPGVGLSPQTFVR